MCPRLVWGAKTLNSHVLTLCLGQQSTEFSCPQAWSGTPTHWIFICSSLVWDPKTLNFHVLKPGLGFSYAHAWFGIPKHWNFMCRLGTKEFMAWFETEESMARDGFLGWRQRLVWEPKTTNFHMLTLGLGLQNTEFWCAHAWLETPKCLRLPT